MSIEPVYFAVLSRQGAESPRLFYERIPPDLLRKGSSLIYATRLDTMEGCDRLLQEPLHKLFRLFGLLRKAGKLPPEDRGPRPVTAKRETTISREHWTPPPSPWDRDAPAYPPLPRDASAITVLCPCGHVQRCSYPHCLEGKRVNAVELTGEHEASLQQMKNADS